jgi:hypothetical protein
MKLRPLSLIAAGCAALALVLQAQFAPRKVGPATPVAPKAAVADRRAPDNTFLTYPEWYLVYSPAEYADFIVDKPPSEFPYLGHVGQLWHGYRAIYDATKDDYPLNVDYHIMILIIATSTTVEYGLKWAYERIVGRVSEATCFGGMTKEDRLAAEVARDYVRFLDVEPWYKFDFLTPLKRVWTETDYWGPDPLRMWERKYYLTSDYLCKAGYAWLIQILSESSYGVEAQTTAVVLDRMPSVEGLPELKVLERYPDGAVLAHVPRYQGFTRYAQAIARGDARFVEIAGNRGPILISAVVPAGRDHAPLPLIMRQPILTRPGRERILFVVPVSELSATIRNLDRPDWRLEHVYDY